MLGAGHRMRRHEMRGLRQMRRHVPDHRALDRADVGDDRARLEVGSDFLRDRAAGADRDAEDDEIGAVGRFRIGRHDAVDDAEFFDPARGFGPSARW